MRTLKISSTFVLVLSVACVAALINARAARASVDARHQYAAVHVAAAPAFDAVLEDPIWQTAVAADEIQDLTTRRPEPLATHAYLLYDNNNLYVGFRADQTGVPINAEHSTNDV